MVLKIQFTHGNQNNIAKNHRKLPILICFENGPIQIQSDTKNVITHSFLVGMGSNFDTTEPTPLLRFYQNASPFQPKMTEL